MTDAVRFEPLDDVPWVQVGAYDDGLSTYFWARCDVCGATGEGSEPEIHAFADAHAVHTSSSPTHLGMGDLVASMAKALGLGEPCTPCEARRRAMNAVVPHVPGFRRTR